MQYVSVVTVGVREAADAADECDDISYIMRVPCSVAPGIGKVGCIVASHLVQRKIV